MRTHAPLFQVLSALLLLVAIMALVGCATDDGPINPINPGGQFTVYGDIVDYAGAVSIYVGKGGLPVLDADVYVNGERVPFIGVVSGTRVTNPLYRLEKLKIQSQDVFDITVQCSAGSASYSVTMPDRPNIVSPATGDFFSDFADIPVVWNSCESANQFLLSLGGVQGQPVVDAPDTSYVFPHEATSPVLGAGLMLQAINGDGGYRGNPIYPWVLNGVYAISSTSTNISVLE